MNDLDLAAALPSVLPPEGVVVTRLSEITARAETSPRLDIAGVRGCADAVVTIPVFCPEPFRWSRP